MICTESRDTRIIEAVVLANEIINSISFRAAMQSRSSFDMSNASPAHVMGELEEFNRLHCISVVTYRPWYRWSKAYARFQPSRPHTVQLSSRKLQRHSDSGINAASLVGSIVHEFIHLVDNFSPMSFGHGNNNPTGKENTAPYWAGRKAKELIVKRIDHSGL